MEEAVLLYYCTGKLAPDKVIGVVPLEQVGKEREQGVIPLGFTICTCVLLLQYYLTH